MEHCEGRTEQQKGGGVEGKEVLYLVLPLQVSFPRTLACLIARITRACPSVRRTSCLRRPRSLLIVQPLQLQAFLLMTLLYPQLR